MHSLHVPVLVCLFLLLSLPVLAEPLHEAHELIADIVVRDLLDGRTDEVRVVATPFAMEKDENYRFLWSSGSVEIPEGTVWFALADESPGILGYHPVQHLFLDADLEILEVRDAIFYPRFYRDGTRHGLTTLIDYRAEPGKVPADRESAASPPSAEAGDRSNFSYNDFYAVIIEGDVPSGDSYSEFWTDNVRMFRILLEYGFTEDHIHVLYDDGTDEEDWFCEHLREDMVDFPANQQDARDLFTWMRDGNATHNIDQVTDQDFIYLFTFDHGGGNTSNCDSTLCFMDGCMADTEFASYFNQIAYKHRAVNMQQCYSGGFIDNLENDTTVISTAANCNESAYEADEQEQCDGHPVKFGEWNYWWMSAMEGHLPWPNLTPVDADTNLDGMISFLEAHNYAVANDNRTEHPMWSDLGGIGDDLSLVTTWAGAHLVHVGHTLQDDGNADGTADAGETHTMPVTLKNNGETDATGISSTLSVDSSWITIQDGDADYPDLIAQTGAGESLPDHYQWSSDPATPDNTQVRFRIDWTSDGGSYSGNAQFFEAVVKVILDVQQVTVEDQEGGDGDGVADPGETLQLAVTLRNRGHAAATDIHGTLTTGSPYAAITDDQADFADILGAASGRSLPPHFTLDIDPGTPDRTWIECTLDVTAADGYSFTLPLRFMVGSRGAVLLVEDGDAWNADILEEMIGNLGFGVERALAEETDPDSWNMYNILVWTAGGNTNSVRDAAWRSDLEQFVADGGKLLIEGGELGYDHRYNTSFRQNVLHMASWSAHGGGDIHLDLETHPLATVPTVMDLAVPLLSSVDGDRDAVNPTADATMVYNWTNRLGQASVIAFDDDTLQGNGGQVVSLFTAVDVIDDSAGRRRDLVENILEWLVGNDRPYLLYQTNLIYDDDPLIGNDNGIPDPGEVVHVAVALANEGSGTATGVWAKATTDHPAQMHLVDNFVSWPNIHSGAVATSSHPHLEIRIDPATACGTEVEILLEITTAEGFAAERAFTFKVGTGGGQHSTYNSTDTPQMLPNPGTLDSVLEVPDLFRIGDLNCRVDLQHSSTTLVRFSLESPEGTTVVLHDGEDYGNHLSTTYDSQTQPHGPGSMSDYDGEIGQGEWHLRITDDGADMMTGRLDGWSLIVDTTDMCYDVLCEDAAPDPVDDTLYMSRTAGSDAHLEWGSIPGAAGYKVWRSCQPQMSDCETVGSTAATTFDESGLPNGSAIYYYQIRTENDCREESP